MDKIKVITVDDHHIFRSGLNLVLNQIDSVEVIAEAGNGEEFLNTLIAYKPDIVFIDIRMPIMDGIEATKKAIELYPDIKIIAISMFGEEEYLEKMIKSGAKGFLLKNIDASEIELALKQVYEGKNYYSSELLPYFTNKFINPQEKLKSDISLTQREIEVLKLVAKGLTNKEIASQLFISKRTVDGHKANILAKTDSKNVVSLLIYSLKHGLVKL